MNLQDYDSNYVFKLLAHHLEHREISEYKKVTINDDVVELDLYDLIIGFNQNVGEIENYDSAKKLFRDFENFLKDDNMLCEIAEDMHLDYVLNENPSCRENPGDIRQSDFLI